jgi:hypothetical protein
MPRSSSPSPAKISSQPSFTSSYSYSSPKTPVNIPTYITHNHPLEKPGFFSNMWQGFGLGAGQSIAMNIFRSDPQVKHVHENVVSTPTQSISKLESSLPKEFVQCMTDNNDKDLCKQFLE